MPRYFPIRYTQPPPTFATLAVAEALHAHAAESSPVAGGGGGGGSDFVSDPVTTAINATGSGVRYDVFNDTDLDAVPFGTMNIGSVVNIFYNATPYKKKIGIWKEATSANPIIINGVTDASGNRPKFDFNSGAGSAAGCNPSGGYVGANDFWSSGTENLGGIMLKRVVGGTYGVFNEPKWIQFKNLEVCGAQGQNTFTAIDGSTKNFSGGSGTGAFAGGFWFQHGSDILVENCVIYDNDLGIFTMAKDGFLSEAVQRLTVRNNRIYGNGVVGAGSQHNLYIQCTNPVIEGNYIGQCMTGAGGSTYKDRSSGTIFRYNWVEASARALDFVQSEDNASGIQAQSDYGIDYCYGNVIVNDYNLPLGGAFASVHVGGDNLGEEDDTTVGSADLVRSSYRTKLYFWNNTYVCRATLSQGYRVCLFQPSLVPTTIECWNNIFVIDSSGGSNSNWHWTRNAGNISLRGNNHLFGTMGTTADQNASNPAKYSLTNTGTLSTGSPLMTAIPTWDYTLGSGSPCLDLSTLPSPMPSTFTIATGTYSTDITQQPRKRTNGMVSRTVQGSAFDLGALERGLG